MSEAHGDFSAEQLAKLDPKLRDALADGAEPFAVKVDFDRAPPPLAELIPLGLAASGRLVIGKVSRAQLHALACRADVRAVSLFGHSTLR